MQPPQGLVDKVRGPEEAEVDRRLAAEDGLARREPGGRAHRRRRRPRPAPDPALLARRPGAVHHAPGRDHEGPAHRRPQRRHVPDAEDRRALDLHALADPQGRPRRLPRHRREDPGRRRARARPGHGLLGERAAAEAHRRVHARRLPQGRAGRARARRRPSTSRCPANAEIVLEGTIEKGEVGLEGPFGDHTGYYTPPEPFPVFRLSAITMRRDAIYPRSSSASRCRRTPGSARRPSGSSCPRSG